MRISIIIPALNEATGIVATLMPLQPWRAQGHEVILVDGGSLDGTPELAEGLTDAVISTTRGRARQLNAGAAAARGDVLLFLHADTRLSDRALATLRVALRGRVWGRFDVDLVGSDPARPARLLRLVAALMNLRSRLTGIATGDQAMFVSRTAFNAVGGFPDQPLMEDIELSRRLNKLGSPACCQAHVATSARRWEEHGVWRTIFLMWRLRFDYWRGVPAEVLAARYATTRREREGDPTEAAR